MNAGDYAADRPASTAKVAGIAVALFAVVLQAASPETKPMPLRVDAAGGVVRVGMTRGPIGAPPSASAPVSAPTAAVRQVHDPLEAVVCYLDDGVKPAVLVCLDSAGMPYAQGRALRDALSKLCGIAADRIVLHFTHTHTGERREDLASVVAPLILEARDRAHPAQVAYAETDTGGRFSLNRRKKMPAGLGAFSLWMGLEDNQGRPDAGRMPRARLERWFNQPAKIPEVQGSVFYDDPVDSLLQGVFFRRLDGKVIGSFVRFACHPAVAGHRQDKMTSADFPAVVRERLRKAFGGECAYLTGPCGNITAWEKGDWVYPDLRQKEANEVNL